jgi:hypothetical protein
MKSYSIHKDIHITNTEQNYTIGFGSFSYTIISSYSYLILKNKVYVNIDFSFPSIRFYI